VCSINEEAVRCIRMKTLSFKEGAISSVSLTLVLLFIKLITDHATTVAVAKFLQKQPLSEAHRTPPATEAAKPGKRTGDIIGVIQTFVQKFGFGIIEELAGQVKLLCRS